MIVRDVTRVTVLANVVVVVVGLVVLTLLPRWSSGGDGPRTAVVARPSVSASATASAGVPSGERAPVTATPESAKKVKANEAGLVPVIMYHRLLPKRIASIDRTPRQFRTELERLARKNYVPITAAEFVSGEIDIPAGSHPVVLTFDDGHPSHFALDAQGVPKRDTAVGIIYEVAAKYPKFRPVATFWINRTPFGLNDRAEQTRAVQWLVERGFEVANHTYDHPDLRSLPTKRVSEQIVRQERLLAKLGTGPSTTLALPYGSRPRKLSVAHDGKWDGTKYDFDGVFLAGAEPAVSPFAKKFERYAIPRIQSNGKHGECSRWCTAYWLDWLDEHPKKRYTSDGDPKRVSIPRKLRDTVASKRAGKIVVY
ncbi:polysaccharide deacetylase family protein [Sphaerimonospora mesophila]|uniref:polysaccharide deacetylase family protein n=1 Tax=Sphaerimonospora mesophila TaxID=37483 RepID=UPI0006E340D9